jgi:hypothetical protein
MAERIAPSETGAVAGETSETGAVAGETSETKIPCLLPAVYPVKSRRAI